MESRDQSEDAVMAGEPPLVGRRERSKPAGPLFWQLAWPVVFAANLIVPLYLGWEVTHAGGRWGMMVAIFLVWLAGQVSSRVSRHSGRVLGVGGVIVALTQFYPLLQFAAGTISLLFVAQLKLGDGLEAARPMTELGGFLATFLTAGQLLGAAIVCGLFFKWQQAD